MPRLITHNNWSLQNVRTSATVKLIVITAGTATIAPAPAVIQALVPEDRRNTGNSQESKAKGLGFWFTRGIFV